MINFSRRLSHSLIICILALLFHKDAPANEYDDLENDIKGLWQTTLSDHGAEMILILDIHSTDNDSLECTIHIPDFEFNNLPYGKFKLHNGSFTLPGFIASYDTDGKYISGTLTAFGPELDVEFTRIESKPLFSFDFPEKEVDWTLETNSPIWSSLTVNDGQLIFGNDAGKLYSINMGDLTTSWIFSSKSKIRSKALVKNNFVYFSSDDGYLYSIHFENGKLNWKAYIGNDASPRIEPGKEVYTYDYLCSSPVIHNGTIYIGSKDSCVYVINQLNGKVKWKYKTGDMIRSTPAVDSDKVYIGSWDNFMYAIHEKDGSLAWKYDAGGSIQSSPLVIDNKLVFGSRSAFIFAIDKVSGEELWKTRYWGSWVESSPVVYDGIIYIGSSDYRKIHAIDPENGEVKWSTRVEGWSWPTPAVNEKYLFTGSIGSLFYLDNMHGRFYGINRHTGKIEWRVKTSDNPKIFAYGFASSPAIWKDWVFFGGIDGTIYGIKSD